MYRKNVIERVEFLWWTPLAVYATVVIVALAKIKLVHFNLRLLMINMIADCVLGAGARLWFRFFIRHKIISLANLTTCVALSFVTLFLFIANCASLCMMCVERYLATLYRVRYERWSGKFGIAAILIKYVVSVKIAILFQAYDFYFQHDQNVHECEFLDGHPQVFGIITALGAIFFSVAILVSWRLYRFNLKLTSRINNPLSVRFQSIDNVAAVRMIISQLVAYALIVVIALPVITIDVLLVDNPADWSPTFIVVMQEIPYVLVMFYITFFLTYVTFFYEPFYRAATSRLFQRLADRLPCSKLTVKKPPPNKPRMNNVEASNYHFSWVAKAWSSVVLRPTHGIRPLEQKFEDGTNPVQFADLCAKHENKH